MTSGPRIIIVLLAASIAGGAYYLSYQGVGAAATPADRSIRVSSNATYIATGRVK